MSTGAARWQPRCLSSEARFVISAATSGECDADLHRGHVRRLSSRGARRGRELQPRGGDGGGRGAAGLGDRVVGALGRAAHLELDQAGAAQFGAGVAAAVAPAPRSSAASPARSRLQVRQKLPVVARWSSSRAAAPARRPSGSTETPQRSQVHLRAVAAAVGHRAALARRRRRDGALRPLLLRCWLGGLAIAAAVVELADEAEGDGHPAHLVGLVGEDEADPGAACGRRGRCGRPGARRRRGPRGRRS